MFDAASARNRDLSGILTDRRPRQIDRREQADVLQNAVLEHLEQILGQTSHGFVVRAEDANVYLNVLDVRAKFG